MKTISIPTNNRPELLQQCLEAILKCPENDDWTPVFSCEPHPETISVVERYSKRWKDARIWYNPVQMGIHTNTFLAPAFAMALYPEFNLYLEDDIVVAADALALCEQFRVSGLPGMVAFRRWHKTEDAGRPLDVQPNGHGLLGDGFAWHARDWPLIRRFWFYYQDGIPGDMWDWSVSWAMDNVLRTPQWRPLVPRSQNIGIIGQNQRAYDENRHSPCYGGTPVERFNFVQP